MYLRFQRYQGNVKTKSIERNDERIHNSISTSKKRTFFLNDGNCESSDAECLTASILTDTFLHHKCPMSPSTTTEDDL